MIEVLVAIIVLSFGMLGAAALQARALRNNQSNYESSQLTLLTQSMFDAMRANIAAVDASGYEMASWTCSPAISGSSLAAEDRRAWLTQLQAQLNSSACGRITCSARDCLVGIRWDDARATGGSSAQTFELRSRL